MNHEARLLLTRLRKVAKENAKRIRAEKQILALYRKLENQQTQLAEIQQNAHSLHINLRTPLPFTESGHE